jgi:hypothetical protein
VTQVTLFANATRCAATTATTSKFTLYSIKNGTLERLFTTGVNFTKFAIFNSSLVSANGKQLQVWNLSDTSLDLLYTNTSTDDLYTNVDISFEGQFVATGNRDKLLLFNFTAVDKLDFLSITPQLKSEFNFFNPKFSPNDTHLITANGALLMHWEYSETVLRIRQSIRAGNNVSTLAVSSSGKYCMCNNKNLVEFYELYKFEFTGNKESSAHPAAQLAYTSDDKYGISADSALSVFNVDYTAANSSDVIKTSTDYYINSENHFGPVYALTVNNGFALSASEGD